MPAAGSSREPSPYARRVLDVVERIPRGRVLTYGDVREWLGESSPRAVGAVLARYGVDVPWWRVVFADGHPAPVGTEDALRRLRDEGVTVFEGRVDLHSARWNGLRS
ncbi:MAG: MGMT family protein [Actinomycetota bacterium]|nr:MGMT family protein [Actinomycetota bacterium]